MLKNLYAFIGRSGSGKTTVASRLFSERGYLPASSYTDRPRRSPDEKGHRFLSPAELDEVPNLIAPTTFGGARYGMTEELLDAAELVIVDCRGVFDLRAHYAGHRPVKVIGVHAPCRQSEERMRARGDCEDAIMRRLDHDEIQFGMMDDLCDIIVVNKDIDDTVSVITAYIQYYEASEDVLKQFPVHRQR